MMRYNNYTLSQYINENNILLTEDYTEQKVDRNTRINGNCLNENCEDLFSKTFRQLVKTQAYCFNCSVKNGILKIKTQTITYNYDRLLEYCNENLIELIHDYSNETMGKNYRIKGKCKTENCDNIFDKDFRSLLKIGGYCYDCSKEKGKVKIKKTNFERYGSEYGILASENRKELQEATIKKFGKKFYSQTDEYKQKNRETCLKKYGVEHQLQIPEIIERIIKTNIEKYGFPNPQQNENVKNKLKETILKKYGKDHYSQTEEYKQKNRETCLKKYGVDHQLKVPEIRERIIKTNIEKYGVPNPQQNNEISELSFRNSFKLKEYTLSSGKIIKYQGYEHFAYNELLNIQNLDENELITSRKEVPEVWYEDENRKRHRYYIDMFIPSQNKCIEVKSTWTMRKSRFVFEKQRAVKELGYECEIWVYDKDGTLIEKHI